MGVCWGREGKKFLFFFKKSLASGRRWSIISVRYNALFLLITLCECWDSYLILYSRYSKYSKLSRQKAGVDVHQPFLCALSGSKGGLIRLLCQVHPVRPCRRDPGGTQRGQVGELLLIARNIWTIVKKWWKRSVMDTARQQAVTTSFKTIEGSGCDRAGERPGSIYLQEKLLWKRH